MPRPDEGLIHAWLDGQLSETEAARVEQLVATDAAWSASAAEARGLIAASSRILSALDHVPAGIVPKGTATPAARRLPWWTKAAAAVVLVAGASSLVMRRTPEPEFAGASRAADTAGTEPISSPPQAVLPFAQPATPPSTRPPLPPAAQQGTQAASHAEEIPRVGGRRVERQPAGKASAETLVGFTAGSLQNVQVPSAAVTASAATFQLGGVSDAQAKGVAAADQASRMQQTEQVRQDAAQVRAGVTAQRTVGEVRREMVVAAPAGEAMRDFAAPAARAARPLLVPGGCFELRDSRTSAVTGAVMRGDRMQGDTLLLVPARTPSPARAWIVTGGDVVRGVLTTEPDGRGMVLVTALPVTCPAR